MVIAVNATNWGNINHVEQNIYAAELIKHSAIKHPESEFICIVSSEFNRLNEFPANVKMVTIKRTKPYGLKWLYQQQVTIPLILKKTKPAIIIQPNGISCLLTKIPQLLFINKKSIASFYQSKGWQFKSLQRFVTTIMLKKATRIATGSVEIIASSQQAFPFLDQPLTLINGASCVKALPIQWEEKEAIKQQYTLGCEYFILSGNGTQENDILTVLKAFSQFKKWQKSNMKLLITGSVREKSRDFIQKLKSYKYREDLILLDCSTEKEYQPVAAAAYAAILLPNAEGLNLAIFQWMQSAVPIVVAINHSDTTIAENAVIQARLQNPQQIAEYLQLLYRDEKYRETYINRGLEQSKSFNWSKSADRLWEEITKTVNLSY